MAEEKDGFYCISTETPINPEGDPGAEMALWSPPQMREV